MVNDPVAARYAQALFETAKAEGRVDETMEPLTMIGQLLHEHPDLRQLMLNPDVDPEDKVGVFERVLKGSWSTLVRAFFQVVVSYGRTESLASIIRAFHAQVDADHGLLRVVVRSAHPLPEAVLVRLRKTLERRERKSIELQAEMAPQLLGGVQLLLDHRVIDGSVARQLHDLREQLAAVRVY